MPCSRRAEPFPGYKEVKPLVFCGLYSTDTAKYEDLRDALMKLRLNDSSFVYEPETSLALGFGFRCGFLGLLHMEIIQERLEREYGLTLITTAPTVVYRVTTTKGEVLEIDNPAELPPPSSIERFEEPFILATVITPERYMGAILQLCQERRGIQRGIHFLDPTRVMISYEMPLNEVILDFYDKLKSRTQGYASLDYEVLGYRESDLVKLDILLNGEAVDALSFITHGERSILARTAAGRENERADSAADVRDRHSSGDRQQSDRPRDHRSDEEECHRKMLRRRHYPQAETPRKTKRRKETDESRSAASKCLRKPSWPS